jgi:hypothetical protein
MSDPNISDAQLEAEIQELLRSVRDFARKEWRFAPFG